MTFAQDRNAFNELRDRNMSYVQFCLFEMDREIIEMADRAKSLEHGKDSEAYILALARLGSAIVNRMSLMTREIEVLKEDQDEKDGNDAKFAPYEDEALAAILAKSKEMAKESKSLRDNAPGAWNE